MRLTKSRSFSTSSALLTSILRKTIYTNSHRLATCPSNPKSSSKQNSCCVFSMPTSGSRDRIGASPSPVSISFKTILTEDGNSWISNISIQRMWRPERRAIGISIWSRMLWEPDNYLPAPFVQYLLSIWGQKKSPITWKRQDVKVTIALSSSMIMR